MELKSGIATELTAPPELRVIDCARVEQHEHYLEPTLLAVDTPRRWIFHAERLPDLGAGQGKLR